MTRQELLDLKLPRTAGVYLFKKGPAVLYVGKATVLAERVRSYFDPDLAYTRSPHVARLPLEATAVETIQTDSVIEALLLEAALIKKLSPPYNTDLKDNKSFWVVAITQEDFPRVLLVRSHALATSPKGMVPVKKIRTHKSFIPTPSVNINNNKNFAKIRSLFGPFPNGGELKEALKIIRRIFPFRDSCTPSQVTSSWTGGGEEGVENVADLPHPNPLLSRRGKSCFNKQIGLCPGVCSGEMTREEYLRTIRHLDLFFQGRKAPLAALLKRELKTAAKARRFEEAARLRDQMYALNHIRDIALIKRNHLLGGVASKSGNYRIEGYDVAHLGGEDAYGVMTVVENGEATPAEYRSFKLRDAKGGDDVGGLREILSRRLGHPEWTMPRLIVVDGGKAQLRAAESILVSLGVVIPLVAVTKDEHHRARHIQGDDKLIRTHEQAILLANSEAHRFSIKLHRNRRGKFLE